MASPSDDERTPGGWALALILFIGLVIPLAMLAVFLIVEAFFTEGPVAALLVVLIFASALVVLGWVGLGMFHRRR